MYKAKAEEIKRLREETYADMMYCKRVLVMFNGDFDFSKHYIWAESCAVMVHGDRHQWNMRRVEDQIGRKPLYGVEK